MTATTDSRVPATGPVPLWRNRDYMLLWSGQGVSVLGSGISGLAFTLLALSVSGGSAAQAGFVGALFLVPYLVLSLPAGVLVDRWDRKRTMIVCDTVRALNIGSIPLAAALAHLWIAQLYVNALVEGTGFVLFNVAEVACLPRVVPSEQLGDASAQNQASFFAAGLIAPPIGGFLYQTLGRTIPFLADAVSYAASVISLAFIRTDFQMERTEARGTMWTDIKEGLAWLWQERLIRTITAITGVLNFTGNSIYLPVIIIARQEHAPPVLIGVIFALSSVGGLCGSLAAPWIKDRLSFTAVIVSSVWMHAVLYPLCIIAPNALIIGIVLGLNAIQGPIYNAVQFGYRLSIIPDHLQGRVNSAVRMVAFGTIPLGTALSGVLIQTIGARQTVLVISAVSVVLAVAVALSPEIRGATTSTKTRLSTQ